MNLERYDFSTNRTFLDYEFYSEGPKGKIKKVIRFSPQIVNGITYFNLGFGDFNAKTGKVDDLVTTDNKDRDKVLATVVSVVLSFIHRFPDALVYAKGSTASRTRLYQIGIVSHWEEVETSLNIYGFSGGNWESFSKKC